MHACIIIIIIMSIIIIIIIHRISRPPARVWQAGTAL